MTINRYCCRRYKPFNVVINCGNFSRTIQKVFTLQIIKNKYDKYVNLKFQKNDDNYLIDGSSYKGIASLNNVVGNWWNHKILTSKSQISPLSGSIKEQVVKFIKKENIIINGKKYLAHKFTLKSKNPNLPEDKKLDFEIWLEPEKNIILKQAGLSKDLLMVL